MTKNSRLLLVDSDSYTASVLAQELWQRGFEQVQPVLNALDLPAILGAGQPDLVIVNYHSNKPDSLLVCSTVRLMAPRSVIVAIVSPGPALKAVRSWSGQTSCIDVIIEKPLSEERFFLKLDELLKSRKHAHELEARAERLASLVPEAALSAMKSGFNSEGEMFEAAVLFTDIRGSSRLIRELPPREFFLRLNQVLSAQTRQINRFEGSVIKYTGDGVMAIFRGMGRSHMALRCGLELASISSLQELPFGVGIAEGLVLAGLIGDSNQAGQRHQYDVISETVHLASRLCGLAGEGEVITTRQVEAAARLVTPAARPIGGVAIKGFDKKIDCAAFHPAR